MSSSVPISYVREREMEEHTIWLEQQERLAQIVREETEKFVGEPANPQTFDIISHSVQDALDNERVVKVRQDPNDPTKLLVDIYMPTMMAQLNVQADIRDENAKTVDDIASFIVSI